MIKLVIVFVLTNLLITWLWPATAQVRIIRDGTLYDCQPTPGISPCDFNNDNMVDGNDFAMFISAFNSGNNDHGEDLDKNGVVDGLDFGIFIDCFREQQGAL